MRNEPGPASAPRRMLVALLAAVIVALCWCAFRQPERGGDPLHPAHEPAASVASEAGAPAPRSTPADAAVAEHSCRPRHGTRCHEGDVWSVDSCGVLEQRLQECGSGPCRDARCQSPVVDACDEPPEGRCAGDKVRLCSAGSVREIDCAALGLRCGHGHEGAECLPRPPQNESCAGEASCDGDWLVRCEDGRTRRTDCRALRARCLEPRGTEPARCARFAPIARAASPCGPCGCRGGRSERESACDGRDDDGNGLIDEGLACGPIPIKVFVVAGAHGASDAPEEALRREIELVNRTFASEQQGPTLEFALDELRVLEDAALRVLDSAEFERLATDRRVHPEHAAFYVPLLITDQIVGGGGIPKPGVSTLPNGTCGGMQQSLGPEVGLIALSSFRHSTTFAHELGHFLGLCHTHDDLSGVPTMVFDPETKAAASCDALCRDAGDGICDTATDPGPEACTTSPACQVSCASGAAPDPSNLMSYYAACRYRFSAEQVQLMQHTLALRRAWHACHGGACACQLGGQECPVDMSCRPVALEDGRQASRCALDGPRGPRSRCKSSEECGQGTLCVAGTEAGGAVCARPCQQEEADCDCLDVGEGLSVCREDLPG